MLVLDLTSVQAGCYGSRSDLKPEPSGGRPAAFVWVSGRFCTRREPHSSREGRSSSEQPKHFGTLGRVAHFVLTRVRPNGVRDALLSKFGALFAKFKVLRHHLYCLTTCRYRIGTHPGPSSAENSSVKKKRHCDSSWLHVTFQYYTML